MMVCVDSMSRLMQKGHCGCSYVPSIRHWWSRQPFACRFASGKKRAMPHRWLRITLSFQLRQKLKFHMLITVRKISDAKTHVQNSEFQTKKTPCLHH